MSSTAHKRHLTVWERIGISSGFLFTIGNGWSGFHRSAYSKWQIPPLKQKLIWGSIRIGLWVWGRWNSQTWTVQDWLVPYAGREMFTKYTHTWIFNLIFQILFLSSSQPFQEIELFIQNMSNNSHLPSHISPPHTLWGKKKKKKDIQVKLSQMSFVTRGKNVITFFKENRHFPLIKNPIFHWGKKEKSSSTSMDPVCAWSAWRKLHRWQFCEWESGDS